jgi:hypothetical protein
VADWLLEPVLLHADNEKTMADAMATASTVWLNFISNLLESAVDDHMMKGHHDDGITMMKDRSAL